MLGKTSKPATLNQASHAHRRASATLHVATALGRYGVVCLNPDCSRTQRDRGFRFMNARASLRNEFGVHGDVIHVPCPDQQRVWCIRSAQIAVTSTLYNQAQTVVPSKVYGGGDVLRVSCRHGVNAWFGDPCVHPAQGLRKPRLISDVIRILEVLEDILARRVIQRGRAGSQGKLYRRELSAHLLLQLLPACGARPRWIGRADARQAFRRKSALRLSRETGP